MYNAMPLSKPGPDIDLSLLLAQGLHCRELMTHQKQIIMGQRAWTALTNDLYRGHRKASSPDDDHNIHAIFL